ncbi:MAG: ATP-dependent Clp protease adaptor protein ClpS [Planctomycetota bacterium]|jgi:ATP-dependent Clp protease adaptor protein ClpS
MAVHMLFEPHSAAKPALAPPQEQTSTDTRDKLSPLYRVICHDDPLTTMEFVVAVLMKVFRLTQSRAIEVMLGVHTKGAAVVARYPKSLAESRVNRARTLARADGFPLTFSIEKDN